MSPFLSRESRVATDCTVAVLLVESASDRIVAGPVMGTLCNISEMGACIEVERPMASGHHLFYEALGVTTCSLVVEGVVPSKDSTSFSVVASAVWMNGTDEERPAGFRIGLRFRERQAQLCRRFKRL